MRIDGGARAPGESGREAGAARFGEALARAGRREPAAARRAEGTRTSGPAGGARRAAAVGGTGALAGEAQGAAAPAAARLPGPAAEVAPIPELAQRVRAVAPAVAVLAAAPGAPLTLSFGRSLEVELRATAAGVEVVLRPDPALARAAHAELPRLVAALRGRGIAVASAAVRAPGSRGGRAR